MFQETEVKFGALNFKYVQSFILLLAYLNRKEYGTLETLHNSGKTDGKKKYLFIYKRHILFRKW